MALCHWAMLGVAQEGVKASDWYSLYTTLQARLSSGCLPPVCSPGQASREWFACEFGMPNQDPRSFEHFSRSGLQMINDRVSVTFENRLQLSYSRTSQ